MIWLRFIFWRQVKQAKLSFIFRSPPFYQTLALNPDEVVGRGTNEEAVYEVAQGPGLNLKLAWGFQSQESSFWGQG